MGLSEVVCSMPAHQVEGALARLRPAPVGDRDERRTERLRARDGAGQGGQLGVVLGREELEGVGLPRRQQVGDPGHVGHAPARPKSSSSRTMSSSPK